ncbi:MAG: cysteine hydrolase [Anaerolineae bacterium]|nr:cysteine hydrolase [Anaerolineae bacterium]
MKPQPTPPGTAKLSAKAVLMVIDAQKDFLSPQAPYQCVNSASVIDHISKAIQIARKHHIPVVFTREVHAADGSDYGMEAVIGEPPHCIAGSAGMEIIDELKPQPGDIVIDKRRYSAFLHTPLETCLNSLGNPVLYITGFCTNACVYCTAIDAFQLDHHVYVIEECVSATSHSNHQMGLAMLRAIWEKLVISLEEFQQAICQ